MLLDVGDNMLRIARYRGKSLLPVSGTDGSARKRVRVAGACTSYAIGDGTVRFLGPHHRQATDLDLTGGRLTRHPLPYGKHAMYVVGLVFALFGRRKDITLGADDREYEPREPIVVGANCERIHWLLLSLV